MKSNQNVLSFFRMNPVRFLGMLLLFTFPLTLTQCDDEDDDAGPDKSIVALAQDNSSLSTLEAALTKFPDLVTTLNGSSQFTVFAPTNEAFQGLLTAIGQTSLDDIPEEVLRDVLEYHVVQGQTLSTQLTAGNVATVGGENIAVTLSGGLRLNTNVQVTTADVRATNGVVHIINQVLVPPSIQPIVGTVVAPAYFNKNFTTLIAAVKAASPSVLQTLLNSSKKTLFAPTNAAFTAAGITALPNQATLDAVLTYHVIGSEVRAANIATGPSDATTLNGKIFLSKSGSNVTINGTSKVTTADIVASNGVVHVIDRTLMPPSKTIATIVSDAAGAATNKQFTQLLAALQRTQGQPDGNDLLAAVSAAGSNLTVFAPTDAAFTELYTTLGVQGVNDIQLSTLIAVLKHHVVGARRFSSDLVTGNVATLNGNIAVNLAPTPPTITGGSGGANVAQLQANSLNILATNGVVHVINKVLLP